MARHFTARFLIFSTSLRRMRYITSIKNSTVLGCSLNHFTSSALASLFNFVCSLIWRSLAAAAADILLRSFSATISCFAASLCSSVTIIVLLPILNCVADSGACGAQCFLQVRRRYVVIVIHISDRPLVVTQILRRDVRKGFLPTFPLVRKEVMIFDIICHCSPLFVCRIFSLSIEISEELIHDRSRFEHQIRQSCGPKCATFF